MHRPLKVAIVASGLAAKGGGAPVSEAGLARALNNRMTVSLLCHQARVDPTFVNRFQLEQCLHTYNWSSVFHLFLGIGNLYKEVADCDVLHINGHWRWENAVFAWAASRQGKPYFLHPRGMLAFTKRSSTKKKVFNFFLGNRLMKGATGVIALSRFECRNFSGRPIDLAKVSVIPNGIDFDPMDFDTKQNAGPFLYFGRIEARKNLIFLVEAYFRYTKLGGRLELLMMGPVERGYDRDIRTAISRHDLDEKIHLLPPDYGPGRDERIRQAIAVVYPAVDEAFGRVPFEALALGTPTLIPDESGAAEYLSHQIVRTTYRSGDADSLANIMREVEISPPSFEEIGRARRWLGSDLNWTAIASRVEDLYNRSINVRRQIENTDGALSKLRSSGNLVK